MKARPASGYSELSSPTSFIERHCRALFLLLVLIGSARIVSTCHVFSHTADEPVHIGCGMEWLSKGLYRWEPQHPPLARVAAALGPFLSGVRSVGDPAAPGASMVAEGLDVVYSGMHYERTLTLARLGILPFFWIGCAVVYLWGKRHFGPAVGVMAVLLFSFLPPVLAHAGLATTDMACAAMLGAALLAGCVLLEEPSRRHAAVFGVCGGLAVLSKFSVLVFFPACVAVGLAGYAVVERPQMRQLLRQAKALLPLLGVSTLVAGVTIWAGYRFSVGPLVWPGHRAPFGWQVPAPELWAGLREVWRHDVFGHPAYALGQRSVYGFWYFFPLALAVKTPIAFLILALAGMVLVVRRRCGWRGWLPVACSAAILGTAMGSRINIGVRHILPIYMGLSLLGAIAVVGAWSTPRPAGWMRAAVVALLLWLAASSLMSHPDYLAYFNQVAARHPEKFLVDSDLDWGQDLQRLGVRLHALGVHRLWLCSVALADFKRQPGFEGIDVQVADENVAELETPQPGWNAVGLTCALSGWDELHRAGKFWPDRYPPRERVGKTILLWYFPPAAANAAR